jgi:hypothetical protein
MHPEEQYMDVLQNIEFVVVSKWRRHPEMSDYAALRVYEAAIAHYNAVARGTAPKLDDLTGLDADVYQAVQGVCEWRLGHRALERDAFPKGAGTVTPIPVADLVLCLKRLRKSVERWNRTGGRQGYLEFISQFVP